MQDQQDKTKIRLQEQFNQALLKDGSRNSFASNQSSIKGEVYTEEDQGQLNQDISLSNINAKSMTSNKMNKFYSFNKPVGDESKEPQMDDIQVKQFNVVPSYNNFQGGVVQAQNANSAQASDFQLKGLNSQNNISAKKDIYNQNSKQQSQQYSSVDQIFLQQQQQSQAQQQQQSQILQNDLILSKIDPNQRETYFLLFGGADGIQNPLTNTLIQYSSNGQNGMGVSTKGGGNWYEQLEIKGEKWKETMREKMRVLKHMIMRRKNFLEDYRKLDEGLIQNHQKLVNGQQNCTEIKFQSEVQQLIEDFKLKIEVINDLIKEGQDLMAIFSLSTQIQFLQHSQTNGNNNQNNNHFLLENENNQFDFEKQAKELQEQYDQNIKTIDKSLNDYKKYMKLDSESEAFYKNTQLLIKVLKESEKFYERAENQLFKFNREMTDTLKEKIEKISESSVHYLKIYNKIEESYDLINKLIYNRKFKIREFKNELQALKEQIPQRITYPFTLNEMVQKNDEILKEIQEQAEKILDRLRKSKQESKSTAFDPICQYFLGLRFSLSEQFLGECQSEMMDCKSFISVLSYSRVYLQGLIFELYHKNNFIKFQQDELKALKKQIEQGDYDKKGLLLSSNISGSQQIQQQQQQQPSLQQLWKKIQKVSHECVKLMANYKKIERDLKQKQKLREFEILHKIFEKMETNVSKEIFVLSQTHQESLDFVKNYQQEEFKKKQQNIFDQSVKNGEQIQAELENFFQDEKRYLDFQKIEDNHSFVQNLKKKTIQSQNLIKQFKSQSQAQSQETQDQILQSELQNQEQKLQHYLQKINVLESVFDSLMFYQVCNIQQISFTIDEKMVIKSELFDLKEHVQESQVKFQKFSQLQEKEIFNFIQKIQNKFNQIASTITLWLEINKQIATQTKNFLEQNQPNLELGSNFFNQKLASLLPSLYNQAEKIDAELIRNEMKSKINLYTWFIIQFIILQNQLFIPERVNIENKIQQNLLNEPVHDLLYLLALSNYEDQMLNVNSSFKTSQNLKNEINKLLNTNKYSRSSEPFQEAIYQISNYLKTKI